MIIVKLPFHIWLHSLQLVVISRFLKKIFIFKHLIVDIKFVVKYGGHSEL